MKYKINGIITLPTGLVQEAELQIDSPTVEIIFGHQSGNGVDGQGNVQIEVKYTFMQGNVKREIQVRREFLWDTLNTIQQQMISEMTIEAWNLILSIPDHNGATQI